MKSCLLSSVLFSLLLISTNAQEFKPEDTEVWNPVPEIVTPGYHNSAPSDAIILFGGKDPNSEWKSSRYEVDSVYWTVCEGVMTVTKGAGSIITRRKFGSCQLHIEWRCPELVEGEGQGRGNSGIYFQSKYEVQILDSYENPTYPNGQAASIYKQFIPLVNASRKPGEWQVYDIIFVAPEFNEAGEKTSSAYFTVLHNGILVQNHVELAGSTEFIGPPKNIAHGDEPLMLQNHGNPVSFRNIWIREL